MAITSDASPQGRSSTRTPPHNLDAEESLLGAMLLSREAIAEAVEIVRVEDFYKPSHGHIFEAVTALYSSGEPVDAVTVAAELQRVELLDAIGGKARLVSLQSATPAISNAARYARIIEELALLRRLIGVAGEIAELGYDIPEDVNKTVDTAETLVYEVAQRRITDSMSGIRELVEMSLDRMETLYENRDGIIGIPTGYDDLDDLLSGLQPSSLYVVGARPAMGKALALDTPIPTPRGWTTMGEIEPGDEVLDERGLATTVTYVSPIHHDRRCFEVVFDDSTVLVADAEHQWAAADRPGGELEVLTTEAMLDPGRGSAGAGTWWIPAVAPIELAGKDLPVDPYVLGCWLAGCHRLSDHAAEPLPDAEHFELQYDLAGYRSDGRRDLSRELSRAGLLGGAPSRIPAAYLRASVKQRLALLQGLMDCAGEVDTATADVSLALADRALLGQVRELICSLGHVPGPIAAEQTRHAIAAAQLWQLSWKPFDAVFRLARKEALLDHGREPEASGPAPGRLITGIRPVPSVPVRCITVDSPSHLYLAGESMIPTHNTAFALGMATHVALEAARPVLFFSLEMSRIELTQRVVCTEARVDSSKISKGQVTESDWMKISHATGRLAEAQLWIDDNPSVTVMEIRSKARRLKSRVGDLGLVVVDYLQLMSGRARPENRQVEVAEISRGLKIMARELEAPVLALSQLSRNLEMRQDKRPILADLRESGSIEQDADVVMFLYRDEQYHPDSPDRGTAEVIVSKHRNGPTGITRLAFVNHQTRFANMAKGI